MEGRRHRSPLDLLSGGRRRFTLVTPRNVTRSSEANPGHLRYRPNTDRPESLSVQPTSKKANPPVIAMTVALATASALCLAFPSTRLFGVGGIALLTYLHPLSLVLLLVLAVVVAVVFHIFQRRFYDALPSSDE